MEINYMDKLMPMIVNIYYVCYFLLAMPVNLLLIYLILYKSPSSFKTYRFLLLNTSISETSLVTLSFLLQIRIVSSSDSNALLPYGPLRIVSPSLSFVVYNIYNLFLCTTYLSFLISMHYRYCLICYGKCENQKILINLLITWAIPIAMLIAIMIPSFEFDIVIQNIEKAHPTYNLLKNYGEYGGFKSITSMIYLVNTAILFGIPYLMPTFILYWRSKIIHQITENQTHLSDRTRKASLDLVRALTVQAIFPMICLIPNVIYFLVSQNLHFEFEFAEFVTFPSCCFPCLIDPMLSIYYVAPFKRFIFRKKQKRLEMVPTISTIPWSSRTH